MRKKLFGGSQDEAIIDADDMSKKENVVLKLKSVLEISSKKFGDTYKDVKIPMATAALLQLVNQAKAQQTEEFRRDRLYRESGTIVTAKDTKGLKEAVDFAIWAYLSDTKELKENLDKAGFTLLKHDKVDEPGIVAHFIALDSKAKVALIGVKGSSSIEDLLTDCCCAAVTERLENSFVQDQNLTEIHCHEGILISAKQLCQDLMPFVKDLFLPLEYKILLCGHSLGAGAANLVAVLLRSKIPALQQKNCIQVKAFASPPVLDHEASLACKGFIDTIVNNSDVIPRCSMANMAVFLECLRILQEKLKEKGCYVNDGKSFKAFLQQLREGKKGEMIMSTDKAFQMLAEAQKAVALRGDDHDNHLYVPGRVLSLYTQWQDIYGSNSNLEEKGDTAQEEEAIDDISQLPVYGVVTDGTSPTLRIFELDYRMIGDHFKKAYTLGVAGILKD